MSWRETLALPGPQAFAEARLADLRDSVAIEVVFPKELFERRDLESQWASHFERTSPRQLFYRARQGEHPFRSWLWAMGIERQIEDPISVHSIESCMDRFIKEADWDLLLATPEDEHEREELTLCMHYLTNKQVTVAETQARLIVLSSSDNPLNLRGQKDEISVRRRHWWRSTHRLDTAVYVWRSTQNHRLPDYLRDEIVEIANWEIDLVPYLIASEYWEGATTDQSSTLLEVLEGFANDQRSMESILLESDPDPDIRRLIEEAHATKAPDQWLDELDEGALETAWSQGLLNRWDGRLMFPAWCWSRSTADEKELLRRARWRAHARSLLPTVDMYRAEVEDWVRQLLTWDEINDALEAHWYSSADARRSRYGKEDPLEVNVLRKLQDKVPKIKRNSPSRLADFLQVLLDVRNDVSHMRPVSWSRHEKMRRLDAVIAELG